MIALLLLYMIRAIRTLMIARKSRGGIAFRLKASEGDDREFKSKSYV